MYTLLKCFSTLFIYTVTPYCVTLLLTPPLLSFHQCTSSGLDIVSSHSSLAHSLSFYHCTGRGLDLMSSPSSFYWSSFYYICIMYNGSISIIIWETACIFGVLLDIYTHTSWYELCYICLLWLIPGV